MRKQKMDDPSVIPLKDNHPHKYEFIKMSAASTKDSNSIALKINKNKKGLIYTSNFLQYGKSSNNAGIIVISIVNLYSTVVGGCNHNFCYTILSYS